MRVRWGVRYGRWWMLQWVVDGTVSIGVHVDPLRRLSDVGPYGPYVDVHIGVIVVSIGLHPARANALALSQQGGIMRPESG